MENKRCWKSLGWPQSLECAEHEIQCMRYAAVCRKCLKKGDNCQAFPKNNEGNDIEDNAV